MLSFEMMMANELVSQEAMTTSILSMSYCERSNDKYVFDVESSGRIARERVTTVIQTLQDTRMQQSIFICC
jgi:hypothetical protein